ncbi:hypothetical protein D1871_17880 [Nakamurella silvestris]|nr:hypothetical protein D1871_17880 [Nakamurella silvestris]
MALRISAVSNPDASYGYGSCTGAVVMRAPGDYDYLLTAAHCTEYSNDHYLYNGIFEKLGDHVIGTGTGINRWTKTLWGELNTDKVIVGIGGNETRLDATLFRFQKDKGSPQYWWGDWYAASLRQIGGWELLPTSDEVCLSGELTGLRCHIKRTGGPVLKNGGGAGPARYMWVYPVSTTDNSAMVAPGDSGAPLIRTYPNNTEYVSGLISLGSNPVPCTGSFSNIAKTCYNKGYATAYSSIEQRLGTSVGLLTPAGVIY